MISKILGYVVLIVLLSLLMSYPLMWLWNWLMPVIFGLPTITVLQALGLSVLSNMFFTRSVSSI